MDGIHEMVAIGVAPLSPRSQRFYRWSHKKICKISKQEYGKDNLYTS